MSKFQGAGGGSSIIQELQAQQLAQPQLPTTSQEQVAAETAPAPEPVQQQLAEAATQAPPGFGAEVNPEVVAAGDDIGAILQEEQRQAIPSMQERWQNPAPSPVMKLNPVSASVASSAPDGGIMSRAAQMAQSVQSGGLTLGVGLRGAGFEAAKAGGDVATAIDAQNEAQGTKSSYLQAAIARVGALDTTNPASPQIDPRFAATASAVVENSIAEMAAGADREIDYTLGEIDPETGDAAPPTDYRQTIAKAQGNANIGQQIALEYQRSRGNQNPEKIPNDQAEVLGDAFKSMWAAQNPELIQEFNDGTTNQKKFQLTPQGEDVLASGASDRKKLFPPKNVKPSKIPLTTGKLLGDTGANVVRKTQGSVRNQDGTVQDFSPVINEAMRNLAQVPNVVDTQRQKILFATALPVLQQFNQNPEVFTSWEAEINNIGEGKLAKYRAAEAQAAMDPENNDGYNAMEEMGKAAQKLANEVKAIAENRKGANYLSYAVQGFQGRISPQQSKFNPTTSKAVRFVTRNAIPAMAKPGSRIDKNLRQMYAMMLVKGADGLLPNHREVALTGASAKLEAWGDRLAEALQMTDAEAEAIAQAIEQGIPANDPTFPQVKPLALDPQQDAELIDAIKSKGEDGPHFIDGLMDFSKYSKARRAGKPHASYFNAYIDGKTNGIASNGIQMGIVKTAEQTGTLRKSSNRTDYLDEDGDVRDVLKRDLLNAVDTNGFDGNVHDYSSELNAVARAVFSHRDLNKKTTMTFGYGKEVDSFAQDMEDTFALLEQAPNMIKDPKIREEFLAALPTIKEKQPAGKLGQTLMTVYAPTLEGVMSPEALSARNIMRSAAILHAATDQLLSIKGPTGMDLNFGRDVQNEYSAEDKVSYRVRQGGESKEHYANIRTSTPSSAAVRNMGETTEAGGYSYNGAVVGPVQALDAATVAKSAAGKSWKRMSDNSQGSPYMHTIYDAFKVDAMGYDVALEEINENWLNTSMEWSYLKETKKATEEKMKAWNDKMKTRDPNAFVPEREATYLRQVLSLQETQSGGFAPTFFNKKIAAAGDFKGDKDKKKAMWNKLTDRMADVGYHVQNPPKEGEITNRQLMTFVREIAGQLNARARFDEAIARTEKNKKELKQEILKRGYRTESGKRISLQYYAH